MGPAVTLNGIILDSADSKANYSYCLPGNNKYIKSEEIIVYRRMSPIGKEKRMIATIIDISSYPEYNKKLVFKTEEVDHAIEFITLFRNRKKELNVKDFAIVNHIDNEEISTLVLNMLKLNDKQTNQTMQFW